MSHYYFYERIALFNKIHINLKKHILTAIWKLISHILMLIINEKLSSLIKKFNYEFKNWKLVQK